MKTSGRPSASLDIRLGDAQPGKQNQFDMLSDAGFSLLWMQ